MSNFEHLFVLKALCEANPEQNTRMIHKSNPEHLLVFKASRGYDQQIQSGAPQYSLGFPVHVSNYGDGFLQSVTNTIFRPEYKSEYIPIKKFDEYKYVLVVIFRIQFCRQIQKQKSLIYQKVGNYEYEHDYFE